MYMVDVLNKDSEMSSLYTAKHHRLLLLLNPGDWTPREDYHLSVLHGGIITPPPPPAREDYRITTSH